MRYFNVIQVHFGKSHDASNALFNGRVKRGLTRLELRNPMRYANLRQFDLNLLLSFQTLIEERSDSRAARRMHLSPSAMSRVFNRLRKMFKDDLLVRTPQGYKVTDRALRAYSEIELLLRPIPNIHTR